MKLLVLTIGFLALGSFSNAYAQEIQGTLSGQYYLTGPIEGGFLQGNSHFYFYLSGNSAKDLYNRLPVKESVNPCSGDTEKNHGNINCSISKDTNEYSCGFSIRIDDIKIDVGYDGC